MPSIEYIPGDTLASKQMDDALLHAMSSSQSLRAGWLESGQERRWRWCLRICSHHG